MTPIFVVSVGSVNSIMHYAHFQEQTKMEHHSRIQIDRPVYTQSSLDVAFKLRQVWGAIYECQRVKQCLKAKCRCGPRQCISGCSWECSLSSATYKGTGELAQYHPFTFTFSQVRCWPDPISKQISGGSRVSHWGLEDLYFVKTWENVYRDVHQGACPLNPPIQMANLWTKCHWGTWDSLRLVSNSDYLPS